MTPEFILTFNCDACGARSGTRCVDDKEMCIEGWHVKRRLTAALARCDDLASETEIPHTLSTFYVTGVVSKANSPTPVGSGVSYQSVHSAAMCRIEARSEAEAKGLGFDRILELKRGFKIDEILVMHHDPSGKGFL